MRKIILIISTLLIASSMMGQKYILPTPSHQPSKAQLKQIERRYGMFLHFGLNTFEDEKWTDGTKPATDYCPSAIDAEQWVRAARDAGMKYIILTVKHHDWFCLWESKYTDNDPKLFTHNGNLYYLPWESTICVSGRWFYHTKDDKYKTLDELEESYRQCTKNDNILILKTPPARDGRLRDRDVELLKQLRTRLGL